jgi:tetratricopeptide (TPR) repeat protein
MRRLAHVLLLSVALGAAASPVYAQTPAQKRQARQHFDEGKAAFKAGKFRDAVTAFERSYALFGAPEILFMIGQCHNGLGDGARAVEFYRRYLKDKPDAKNRAEVEALIAEAQAKRPPPVPRLAPVPVPPPPIVPTATAEPVTATETSRPFFKSWWFWTGVGAAVVAGVVVGVVASGGPENPRGAAGTIDCSNPQKGCVVLRLGAGWTFGR